MNTTTAVEMRNITKRFGPVIANNNVSLDIRRGEILALLGENGSGKTTLMNMLAGIYFPDSGTISVNGKPAVYTWSEQSVIGYEQVSVVTEGQTTTFTNALWKRPEHNGGKKPKTPGAPVEYIDEYDTPLGVEIMINHVGDCFD